MTLFLVYVLLILQLLVTLGIAIYLIGSFISITFCRGVPYVPIYDEDIKLMKENLKLIPGKTIIDLGCGDGKALRLFVKHLGIKKAVGYDINFAAIWFGKFINKIYKINNIELFHGNFLNISIEKYDYIYIYLLTEYMERIEDFVFKNMGDNTVIISNTFKFKNHKPFKIIQNKKGKDRILLYNKNSL
ncbi:class I SAM-dependent methyltransferase [Candidatus Gracilibacteria bacterium]|nr:class I SAM-dependent methyltransferase [Candidatus Gracilibacteria bacterium]